MRAKKQTASNLQYFWHHNFLIMRYSIFLFSLALSFFVFSCGNAEQEVITEPSTQEDVSESIVDEQPALDTMAYLSMVENLRVRAEPNLKADVMTSLREGQEVRWTGEKSSFEDIITLRDEKIKAPWMKIEIAEEQGTGWVFGGALEPKVKPLPATAKPGEDFKKEITFTHVDLENFLEIQLADEKFMKTYRGFYTAFYTPTGEIIKNGKFDIVGKYHVADMGYDVVHRYTGKFVKDEKDGLFECDIMGYEGGSVTSIYFEEGDCSWGLLKYHGEGEEEIHKVEDLKKCAFTELYNSYLSGDNLEEHEE